MKKENGMEKTKQIETKEDFLKWAHDVNLSTESKRNGICDLQDVFYRGQDGDMKNLKTMFLDATDTEKQLLTFSIIKAMGEETAYRFIKSWARKQAQICIDEHLRDIDEESQRLSNDKMVFVTEKREIENKMSAMSKEIEELKEMLTSSRINNDGLHTTITRLQDTINTQNNDLDEAYKTINETAKFKTYLKSIVHSEEL